MTLLSDREDGGVPGSEQPVGPMLQSFAETGLGISANVPHAPSHEPGPWKIDIIPSEPMKGSRGRRGERSYAEACIESSHAIKGGKRVHKDGSEHPLFREVCSITYADWDPEKKVRVEATAQLIAQAPSFYEGVAQMLTYEQAGGDGWWKGWEMLKAAFVRANDRSGILPTKDEDIA